MKWTMRALVALMLVGLLLLFSAPRWEPVLRAEEEIPPVADEGIHAGEKDLGGLSPTPAASWCCTTEMFGGTFHFEEEPGMCWYIVGPACAYPDLSSCAEICGLCQAGSHSSTIAPCLPEGYTPKEWLEEWSKQWLINQGLAP